MQYGTTSNGDGVLQAVMHSLKCQVSQLVRSAELADKRKAVGLLDIGDPVAVARHPGGEWQLGLVTRTGDDSIDAIVVFPGPRWVEMCGLWHHEDERLKSHAKLLARPDMMNRGVFRFVKSWERGHFQRELYTLLLRYLAVNDDRVGVLFDALHKLCSKLGEDALAEALRECGEVDMEKMKAEVDSEQEEGGELACADSEDVA